MDLDDSFTEKILQEKKLRQKYIEEKKKEMSLIGKKRAALVDEHQLNSENPPEESPKRQCTEGLSIAFVSSQDKENVDMQDASDAAFIPIHSATKVRGLAALKKNLSNDDDENVTSRRQVNKSDTYFFSTNSSDLCTKPKSRLANLAADIRQWEDDTHQPTLSSNVASVKVTKNQMPLSNTPNSASKTAFAMKLYYTNSKPSSVSSEKHVNSIPLSGESAISISTGDKKGLGSISACKSGNIQVGSVGSRQKIHQAWNQAVAATLETPTSVKSPVKPVSEFTSNGINHDSDPEENSGDESIDENDFAENYNNIKSDSDNKMEIESPVKQVRMEKPVIRPLISEKVTVEISKPPVLQETNKSNVDPAELPLSARKALFEKALLGGAAPNLNEVAVDKLSVAQRAAMFETAAKHNIGAKASNFKGPNRIAVSKVSKFEKNGNMDVMKSPVKTDIKPVAKVKASPIKMKQPESITAVLSPTKNVGTHTRFIHQKLIESSGSTSQDKEVIKVVEERKKEISSLVNHWEKLSSSSSVENNSEGKNHSADDERISYESEPVQEHADDVDEESESGESEDNMNDEPNNDVAEDEMYDCDHDNEVEDDEFENGENVFFRQENKPEIEKEVEETCNSGRHGDSISPSGQNCKSEVSSVTSVSGISSYTDDSNYHASKSESCSSGSSLRSCNFNNSTPQESVEKVPKTSEENAKPEVPLFHTVSFYRKQKNTKLTPVRTIVRREKVSSPESPPDVDYTQVIQQRLKALQDEVLAQQSTISQASRALNLCTSTVEFSGSVEQVEFEKHLLIATQKRQACLNEIQRLKTCRAQGESITDGTGTLTISDLQLPLKREFVASQLEGKGNDTVHYFLCLIRHGSQVIVTQMMSTDDRSSDGTLHFSNHIQLRDLPANFSIVFEVYALQTKKEALPHEKKYHIRSREHSKIRLTPKGKKLDSKMPAISSPGGPDAVRSPSFGVVGFTRFTLQNCNKKVFTLDKVPFTSPLEGVLRINLLLLAEHKVTVKGFLTMFEDISGFGAWQRRWCALDVNRLTYWKYPDDEHIKEPIGSIDLRQCITEEVKLVSRDVCARPHTFQFVTIRPAQKGDKETLISMKVNTLTSTKHLLSADTKDERILWCNRLNEALTNMRKWDPQALKPQASEPKKH